METINLTLSPPVCNVRRLLSELHLGLSVMSLCHLIVAYFFIGFCSVLEGLTGSSMVCGKLGEQGNVVEGGGNGITM
jgi:hypothetical protein